MFSLAQGLHQRHVAATQMNELSSRPDVTLLDIERTSHTNMHSHTPGYSQRRFSRMRPQCLRVKEKGIGMPLLFHGIS